MTQAASPSSLLFEDRLLVLRYAVVDPDDKMGYTDADGNFYKATTKSIQEITPSVVYFLRDKNVRFIADLAYQIDVPVSRETGHGVYNLMRQGDQISYAAKGGIELQDNFLASLIVQYDF